MNARMSEDLASMLAGPCGFRVSFSIQNLLSRIRAMDAIFHPCSRSS